MMLERLSTISQLDLGTLSTLMLKTEETKVTRAVTRTPTGLKKPPSLVRSAVAMLLQNPALVQHVPDSNEFAGIDAPGVELLRELLTLLQAEPQLNTAAVMERFRQSEYRPHLEKLVVWTHPMLEHDVEAEFRGLLEQLRRVAHAQRTDALLNKERAGGLDQAERAELGRLLAEKTRLDTPEPNR
jgi:DNA primase